ncbi:AbrB family transcriptional regulator [Bifidobacterium castoris]|uniref:AbrB family transcriptional regulator n=2 Tax=Bifidobacterium castoris TaxID=2306972 RepID=A0A430F4L1_9BIFI|nr:AbrB family transcriptional regulator [Bifidobacterium castoris]
MTDETMTGETTGADDVDAPMTNDQPAAASRTVAVDATDAVDADVQIGAADATDAVDEMGDTNAHAQTIAASEMNAEDVDAQPNVANASVRTDADADGDATDGVDATEATDTPHVEPLTTTYERLRHSTDAAELHEFARRPLPDRGEQAAFSRATALLEAVAGNPHTPEEDRVFLASTMPFPNVLVKLSEDPSAVVRQAVAANIDDKNWLVGRLTKDDTPAVRDEALRNKRTSWKMRLEGAQDPEMDVDTLDFLSRLGAELEPDANVVLSSMVRRAVALNPNASQEILERLSADSSDEVVHAARRRLGQ